MEKKNIVTLHNILRILKIIVFNIPTFDLEQFNVTRFQSDFDARSRKNEPFLNTLSDIFTKNS